MRDVVNPEETIVGDPAGSSANARSAASSIPNPFQE